MERRASRQCDLYPANVHTSARVRGHEQQGQTLPRRVCPLGRAAEYRGSSRHKGQ